MTGTGAPASARTSRRPALFRFWTAISTFRQAVCCRMSAPTVAPDAYQNVIRVAPPDAMDWPHIVVDRNPGSPFEGYLYLVGTKDTIQNNALWTALVVVRSPDGGRTFDAPRLFEAFRGISFS